VIAQILRRRGWNKESAREREELKFLSCLRASKKLSGEAF